MANTITPAFSIVTQPLRDMWGKSTGKIAAFITGRYGANLFQVEARTATEAKSELIQAIAERLEDGERPSYVVCGDGKTILCVFRTLAGWEYEIIDGSRSIPCGCLLNCQTRKEALATAVHHADGSFNGTINILRSL